MDNQSLAMLLMRIIVALFSIYAVECAWKLPDRFAKMVTKAAISNAMSLNHPSLKTSPKNVIDFLHILQDLKLEKRTGWHVEGIPYEKTESIADHMYRMSIMAWLVPDESIDLLKAMKMALVHDMAEAIVGDITPACGVSEDEKHRREMMAMQAIRDILGDNPLGLEAQELWMEYAADSTKESQFVKDIDKTELYVQVVEYENVHNINFQHWLDRSRPKIRHPGLQAIVDEVELERPAAFLALKNSQLSTDPELID